MAWVAINLGALFGFSASMKIRLLIACIPDSLNFFFPLKHTCFQLLVQVEKSVGSN